MVTKPAAAPKPAATPAPAAKVTLSASPRSDAKPPLADKPVAYTPTSVSANKASASRGFDGPVGKSAPATSPIIKSDSPTIAPFATTGESAALASKSASPTSPASRETDRSRAAASDTILDRGQEQASARAPLPPEQMKIHDDDTYPYRISSKVDHAGIDLEAPKGTPISAVKGGVVETAFNGCQTDGQDAPGQCGNNLGNHVVLRHDDGAQTVYAHMEPNTITVAKGKGVTAGQVIGQVGTTGRSSGPHLHWEYYDPNDRSLNPLTLIPGQYEDLTSTRKAGEM